MASAGPKFMAKRNLCIIKRARPSHAGPESSAASELGTGVGACSGREIRAGQARRRDSGTGLTSTGLTPSPHTLTPQRPGASWLGSHEKKTVIVGGVAAWASTGHDCGASTSQPRSSHSSATIMSRSQTVALRYHIGRHHPEPGQSPAADPREPRKETGQDVVHIDRDAREVDVRDLVQGRTYRETYDKLVLCPGAELVRQPIPGADDPRVDVLRNIPDKDPTIAQLEVVLRPPGAQTGILLAHADGHDQSAVVGKQACGGVGIFLQTDDFDAAYQRMNDAASGFSRPLAPNLRVASRYSSTWPATAWKGRSGARSSCHSPSDQLILLHAADRTFASGHAASQSRLGRGHSAAARGARG